MGSMINRPRRAPASGAAAVAPAPIAGGPAALAASRVSRAGLLLGALGLAAPMFVVMRLLADWRVSSHSAPNRISILGQKLTYAVANFDAMVVLLLAALGSVVTAMTLFGLVREVGAARRFRRRLAEGECRRLGGAVVIDDQRPRAFCAGFLRPRVYVSIGRSSCSTSARSARCSHTSFTTRSAATPCASRSAASPPTRRVPSLVCDAA
jgi:hypothetical protein